MDAAGVSETTGSGGGVGAWWVVMGVQGGMREIVSARRSPLHLKLGESPSRAGGGVRGGEGGRKALSWIKRRSGSHLWD